MAERIATASCRRCHIIRWYLGAAGALVALMLFAPGLGAGLAPVLPEPAFFGYLVPILGIPAFVIRLVRWHLAGRP